MQHLKIYFFKVMTIMSSHPSLFLSLISLKIIFKLILLLLYPFFMAFLIALFNHHTFVKKKTSFYLITIFLFDLKIKLKIMFATIRNEWVKKQYILKRNMDSTSVQQ